MGTRVDGNVLVSANARLIALGVRIGANIQAEDNQVVRVVGRRVGARYRRSRVEGDIQLFSGGSSEIRHVVIDGNLQESVEERTIAVQRCGVSTGHAALPAAPARE